MENGTPHNPKMRSFAKGFIENLRVNSCDQDWQSGFLGRCIEASSLIRKQLTVRSTWGINNNDLSVAIENLFGMAVLYGRGCYYLLKYLFLVGSGRQWTKLRIDLGELRPKASDQSAGSSTFSFEINPDRETYLLKDTNGEVRVTLDRADGGPIVLSQPKVAVSAHVSDLDLTLNPFQTQCLKAIFETKWTSPWTANTTRRLPKQPPVSIHLLNRLIVVCTKRLPMAPRLLTPWICRFVLGSSQASLVSGGCMLSRRCCIR